MQHKGHQVDSMLDHVAIWLYFMPHDKSVQGHHTQRPKSLEYLDVNTARSPRPGRERAISPRRKGR